VTSNGGGRTPRRTRGRTQARTAVSDMGDSLRRAFPGPLIAVPSEVRRARALGGRSVLCNADAPAPAQDEAGVKAKEELARQLNILEGTRRTPHGTRRIVSRADRRPRCRGRASIFVGTVGCDCSMIMLRAELKSAVEMRRVANEKLVEAERNTLAVRVQLGAPCAHRGTHRLLARQVVGRLRLWLQVLQEGTKVVGAARPHRSRC
jgi:hypothetical protein